MASFRLGAEEIIYPKFTCFDQTFINLHIQNHDFHLGIERFFRKINQLVKRKREGLENQFMHHYESFVQNNNLGFIDFYSTPKLARQIDISTKKYIKVLKQSKKFKNAPELTTKQADLFFQELLRHPLVQIMPRNDNCYTRSMVAHALLAKQYGEVAEHGAWKIWMIYGDKLASLLETNFHTALIVKVDGDLKVLDPLENVIYTLEKWMAINQSPYKSWKGSPIITGADRVNYPVESYGKTANDILGNFGFMFD